MTTATAADVLDTDLRPVGRGRRPPTAWLGTVPFFAYVGVFLLLPTAIVVWNAFQNVNGGFNPSNVSASLHSRT